MLLNLETLENLFPGCAWRDTTNDHGGYTSLSGRAGGKIIASVWIDAKDIIVQCMGERAQFDRREAKAEKLAIGWLSDQFNEVRKRFEVKAPQALQDRY